MIVLLSRGWNSLGIKLTTEASVEGAGREWAWVSAVKAENSLSFCAQGWLSSFCSHQ
jgi:hypothetical protein